MLEENSLKVLESLGDSPSFVTIAVNAVKDRINASNVCCVQLQNGQYIIGAIEPNRKDMHLFIPCNSPGAPSTVSWTADHFVNEMLPHPSQCKILVNTICEQLHLNCNESNARFSLLFLDGDFRPLFVSAQRGIIDAEEFNKEITKRDQSSFTPAFSHFPADDSDWLCEGLNSDNDVPWNY